MSVELDLQKQTSREADKHSATDAKVTPKKRHQASSFLSTLGALFFNRRERIEPVSDKTNTSGDAYSKPMDENEDPYRFHDDDNGDDNDVDVDAKTGGWIGRVGTSAIGVCRCSARGWGRSFRLHIYIILGLGHEAERAGQDDQPAYYQLFTN